MKKWGNSAAVRVPISVMQQARLTMDQAVEIRAEDGRIIIEPAHVFELDDLLAEITDDNRHDEADTGVAVGRETL
ncbi:MAG TPA: AbrB/MazE/SpoVT family DNA-binding domain-containing protein [Vineibacter sp.]|nr:AbrB/MazE/SpoVT family DNA-binding domain-containing protein [Vineibacter sp.]